MEVLLIGVLAIVLALFSYNWGKREGYSFGYLDGQEDTNKVVREYFKRNSKPIEFWDKE